MHLRPEIRHVLVRQLLPVFEVGKNEVVIAHGEFHNDLVDTVPADHIVKRLQKDQYCGSCIDFAFLLELKHIVVHPLPP